MSSKFWTGLEEIEAQEERKRRQRLRAEKDAEKKAEKRRQKQEKQKQTAKTESYTKKVEKNTPAPLSISDLRLSQLRLLGLTATQDNPVAVRSAYRRLALQYHPDKNPSAEATELFKKILAAYQGLL